ncbi:hypothetical protein C8R34_101136 [Nitrosomonas sp. Nm84]|uniref:hypothetical protein n=1 Tax=Nitrosomonas sp. Nm84 TaxID=200124 RepID=UPI000D752059|nr:hypothetical protein [Nitrosomonas sp. Nm84]PXW91227.1 hypothetical protein C8R34_101136 [Nitrosomonas sp. Nm84]
MDLKSLSRILLYFSVIYNIMGFISFAFPATIGKAAELPAPPQLIYSVFGAGTILIWAFVYLYLARQREFNRPLLWVGVAGKLNIFTALLIAWAANEIPLKPLLMGGVDLFMGCVWLSYLLTNQGQVTKSSDIR